MIDPEDFPRLTPEQHLARARRIMNLKDWAAAEAEVKQMDERFERLFLKYITRKKDIDLKLLTTEQLLERFEEICFVEWETRSLTNDEGIARYNDCYAVLDRVSKELKSRGEQARRKLSCFYSHWNYEVRLKAAIHSYRVNPDPARRCLEELRQMRLPGVSLDAGMTLRGIDDPSSMLS